MIAFDIRHFPRGIGLLFLVLAASAAADWPMLGHDGARSGATATQLEGPFARKWYRAFPDEGIMTGVQPVVDSSCVYIGTLRGVVHAIDAESGRDVWTRKLGGPVLHSCALGGGRVFVGAGDGLLYALDAKTGDTIWTRQTGAAIWNAPLLWQDSAKHNDLVLFGSRTGKLYACSAQTGQMRWTAQTGGPLVCSPAINPKTERVVIGSEDMHVYAFDLDGRQIWKSPKLPGVSFRGYHPVIAPDGSVMITVTPFAGGDAIGELMQDMVKEVFGNMASWRHKKEENERYKRANFELLKDPQTYSRQIDYLRKRLAAEPAYQTFFVLDPQTGKPRFVTPIVYAESMNGGGSPAIVAPDGRVIVKYSALLKSRYGQYSPFLNAGYLDTQTGDITPVMDQSREYGWYDSLLLVHDEQSQLSVGGHTLYNAHQDNVNSLDLVTLRGSQQPLAHNVHEVQPGVATSLWAMHLDRKPLPLGWEWFARGTAVYGGGSAIDVPIAIAGDSFYYLPTHEINAGVVILAYRMDKEGRASNRAAPPKTELTVEHWAAIRESKWDWDTLAMPRLNHVLKQGLPDKTPGTLEAPLIEEAKRKLAAIDDATLDGAIWNTPDPHLNRGAISRGLLEDRDRLNSAVEELLSQKWRPLLFPAGKHPREAYAIFIDPSETLYTLALAFPHLTVKLQQKAKAHVSDLLSGQGALAAGNERDYPLDQGAVRSRYDVAPARLLKIQPDLVRSRTAQLYPRWLWAHIAGDWEPLKRDWPKLRLALDARPARDEYDLGNGRIAGLIAACRIAKQLDDDETRDRLLRQTRDTIRTRLEYELAHTEGGVMTRPPVLRTIFGRWRHLTPDVARLLREHAGDIHRRLADVYVDHHRPAWWLAWGPELMWRNETPFSFPTMSAEIFAAKALILREPAEKLTQYIDQPWCKADEYYIQKLALALAASRDNTK
jgi:outer membrane protein assembly factor BamB